MFSHVLKRIIRIRVWLIAFSSLYTQISGLMPYIIVAPFYYAKQVTFGVFNQAADAFGNVNGAMNFFVDRYIGFADFRATVDRLTSFDEAFARVEQEHAAMRGVQVTVGADKTSGDAEPGFELAERPHVAKRRRPHSRAAGANSGRRPVGRRKVDPFSRHRRALAVSARARSNSPSTHP